MGADASPQDQLPLVKDAQDKLLDAALGRIVERRGRLVQAYHLRDIARGVAEHGCVVADWNSYINLSRATRLKGAGGLNSCLL